MKRLKTVMPRKLTKEELLGASDAYAEMTRSVPVNIRDLISSAPRIQRQGGKG